MMITADDLETLDGVPLPLAQARARTRATVALDIVGRTSAVHFDDVEAARAFAARYADLTTTVNAYDAEAFALRDPAGGRWFWSVGGPVFRWPHSECDAALQTFFADAAAITAFFLQRNDGVLSLHAATVAIPGAAAALIGESNVGKTTTAIACARLGLLLYGDERCVIDRTSRVHAFPRALNIRDASRRLLLEDSTARGDHVDEILRARPAGGLNDVRFADLLGSWSRPERERLRAVFVLDGLADEPELRRTTPADAARAVARWAHGAGAGLDKIARLLDLFAPLACYRLVLGTPSASATVIGSVLQTCR